MNVPGPPSEPAVHSAVHTPSRKPALRRAVLSRRAALPPDDRARSGPAAADALADRAPARVAAYLSVGTEPGTAELLAALAAREVEVLLPVLLADGDLDWARAGDGVAPGPRGLLEPVGERLGADAVAGCGLVVVPALSVDRDGVRLGRGGGSYDRALTRATGWVVALLHDGEPVVRLPREDHDVPVDAVVVPSRGLVRLRPHAADPGPHPDPHGDPAPDTAPDTAPAPEEDRP